MEIKNPLLKLEAGKYYNRMDGKLTGMLQEKNNNFWDETNQELYQSNGLLFTNKTNEQINNEDICSLNTDYRKVFLKIKESKRYIARDLTITNKLRKLTENNFIDDKTGFLYDENGYYISENNLVRHHKDLILTTTNSNLKLLQFIQQFFDSESADSLTEEDLCLCNICIDFREDFDNPEKTAKNSKFLETIEDIKNYYTLTSIHINLPELPKYQSFRNISWAVIDEMNHFYKDLYTLFYEDLKSPELKTFKFDEIELNSIPIDIKEIVNLITNPSFKDTNPINKTKTKYDYALFDTLMELKSKFQKNKNIIIILKDNKFLKLPNPGKQAVIDSLNKFYNESKVMDNLTEIKFNPVLAELSISEIKNNGFFETSKTENPETLATILNPKYIYSINIINGVIKSVIPITKK